MPLYDWVCPTCETVDEIIGRPDDREVCEVCGAEMERLPSAPSSFRFDHVGWFGSFPGGEKMPMDDNEGLLSPLDDYDG